ncbi:MAG TPA: hypothetical protein VF047_11020 [Nitrososphaeraceae archaeon]
MIWRTFIKHEISNWKHTKWSQGINGSEIEKVEKIKSLKRVSVYSNILLAQMVITTTILNNIFFNNSINESY